MVIGTVVRLYGGEHRIRYRLVKSPCCTLDTKVTLCINSTSIFKKMFALDFTFKGQPLMRHILFWETDTAGVADTLSGE